MTPDEAVVQEAEGVADGCEAKEATPRPTCGHQCLLHDGHVKEGKGHFYGYIHPDPATRLRTYLHHTSECTLSPCDCGLVDAVLELGGTP